MNILLLRSGFGSFLLMLNFGFSKPMSWSESPQGSDLTPLKARYHHQFISWRYTSTILPTQESLVIQFCIHLCRLIETQALFWNFFSEWKHSFQKETAGVVAHGLCRGSWPHLDERYLEGRRRHILEEQLGLSYFVILKCFFLENHGNKMKQTQ